MLPEISLNVLDITQNSIKAEASLIHISVITNDSENALTVTIKDNGNGMTKEQVERVIDPFFTTRTTRKVGLGVPFFKQAAEATNGSFYIESEVGVGTNVTAIFKTDNIDCMPLGDINATIHELVTMNTQCDFVYYRGVNDTDFTLDTREFKEILGDVPLDLPDVSIFIRQYLEENEASLSERKNS